MNILDFPDERDLDERTMKFLWWAIVFLLLTVLFFVFQGWLESWTCVSSFQSVFQLGAASSLTFAFAGPKIADLVSGRGEEIQRNQAALDLLSQNVRSPDFTERKILLANPNFVLSEQIYDRSLTAPNRATIYIFYTCVCFLLLLYSVFSTSKWQNKNLAVASIIALVPPLLDLWMTKREADTINDLADALRKLAMSNLDQNELDHKLKVEARKVLSDLEKRIAIKRKN